MERYEADHEKHQTDRVVVPSRLNWSASGVRDSDSCNHRRLLSRREYEEDDKKDDKRDLVGNEEMDRH
jgi:hypothetical protein